MFGHSHLTRYYVLVIMSHINKDNVTIDSDCSENDS